MIFQDCEADGLQLSEKETWIRLGHSRKNLLYIMGGIVAPSRGIRVPWAVALRHKRLGEATPWSQPIRAQYLDGSGPMRVLLSNGLHLNEKENRDLFRGGCVAS